MKLLLTSLLLSATAMAAETPAGSAPIQSTHSPKQICEEIVKAAVDGNYKEVLALTAQPTCPKHRMGAKQGRPKGASQKVMPMAGMDCCMSMHNLMSEEGFRKMREKEMERIKDINCREERIAEDHAFVEASSQNKTRLVPFKKVDGQWKFDLHAYHAFYPPSEHK